MIDIQYVKGDASKPMSKQPGQRIVIAHISNDCGVWGAGFSGALSNQFPRVEQDYRARYRDAVEDFYHNSSWYLGMVIDSYFSDKEILVSSMIAQRGIRSVNNPSPIDYPALSRCLCLLRSRLHAREGVGGIIRMTPEAVHMPKIGAGLAGGTWEESEEIVRKQLSEYDIPVMVYTLESIR